MLQAEGSSLHVAIIMDGNGRWATQRGLPRLAGHRAGAEAVRRVVEAAPQSGIAVLTLFAFSADNWQRPAREVRALMGLFRSYLAAETPSLVAQGVHLNVIGRRDRLPSRVQEAVEAAEAATARGDVLRLRIAVDYSARDCILRAARMMEPRDAPSHQEFARVLARAMHAEPPAVDVDLLIRTSGEQRLSDFLLWECAYAEMVFTRTWWPDFSGAELRAAIEEFNRRDRRFGGISEPLAVGQSR